MYRETNKNKKDAGVATPPPPLTSLYFVLCEQTLLVAVCGYTFSGKNIPKSHKPLLSNNLGVYEHAQDWRVRPYSAARESKSLCLSRDIAVVNTGTKVCFYFFTLFQRANLSLKSATSPLLCFLGSLLEVWWTNS